MKRKKVLSFILSLVLAFSMATPAFAENDTQAEASENKSAVEAVRTRLCQRLAKRTRYRFIAEH